MLRWVVLSVEAVREKLGREFHETMLAAESGGAKLVADGTEAEHAPVVQRAAQLADPGPLPFDVFLSHNSKDKRAGSPASEKR